MKFASLFLYIVMAIFIRDRIGFGLLFSTYTALFVIYYWNNFRQNNSDSTWWIWAIAFRLPFLLSIPYLSDDFYRFIWDGYLQNQGINPYQFLPSEIQENIKPGEIFSKLNSQDYYSVYPPLNQLLFRISNFLSPNSVLGQVLGLRILLWFFEFWAIWLISRIAIKLNNKQTAKLFALNPLLIIETSGNLHFEIVIVFFVLLAIYLFKKFPKKWFASATAIAAAISVKLIPILLLPLILKKLKLPNAILYSFVSVLLVLLSFIPFWNEALAHNFFKSVDLFFRNFEFNASIYYLIRALGFLSVGYNVIHIAGLGLKLLSGLLILLIALKTKDIAKAILSILFIYLLFATTVHPWYLIPLIAASIFTNIRFPIVWSYLIFLSYCAYSGSVFYENLWIVALEYTLLAGFILFEYKKGLLKLW